MRVALSPYAAAEVPNFAQHHASLHLLRPMAADFILKYWRWVATLIAALSWAPLPAQTVSELHPHLRYAFQRFQQRDYWQADGELELLHRHSSHAALQIQALQLRGVLDIALDLPVEAEFHLNQLTTQGQPQDRGWLLLANRAYRQANHRQASAYLSRIESPLSGEQDAERRLLLAQLALQGKTPDDAIRFLVDFPADSSLHVYARYNLGLALLQQGQVGAGKAVWHTLAETLTRDEEQRALRDRIYMGLGYFALAQQDAADARRQFEQVRLEGLYSGRSLLGMGQAWMLSGKPAEALTYWEELRQRDNHALETHEASLASAQAFQQLGAYPQALSRYQQIDLTYDDELQSLTHATSLLSEDNIMDDLMTIVMTDDWQHLRSQSLQPLRGWLSMLASEQTVRMALQTLAGLRAQHRELLAMQQHLATLTPQHISTVRKGIRVRAAPVTAAQQQRLVTLRHQLPQLLQRSTELLRQQQAATVQTMQRVMTHRADVLRAHQLQARRGVIEILEHGLQSHER